MWEQVRDILNRHLSGELAERVSEELNTLCEASARLLALTPPAALDLLPLIEQRIVSRFREIEAGGGPSPATPSPETLEWARRRFTDEEAAAGLRDIRETGGLKFDDVIRGLEPPAPNG
jgi:hypothetical protein